MDEKVKIRTRSLVEAKLEPFCLFSSVIQTSCLKKSLVLKCFYGLKREKIIEYDFCPHREYLVAVSLEVKSFQ